ncbi:TetR family transcriptional regulator [Rhodococcus sp. SRB_17]|nr:TetR family transcriptional regulator [Rhodococcus sp. SRB_17]
MEGYMPTRTRVAVGGGESAPRTRPKDRKAQIAAVAAEAFSERGYHAVGIDDIASAVGVSGPALYRHFPNKYALFVHAVENLSRALLDATDAARCARDDPREQLQAVMVAVIGVTLENRRRGGLYRWEGRYLEKADRENLRLEVLALRQRIADPLSTVRPELDRAHLDLVTLAVLSVIGSVTAHRSALPPKQIEALMLSVCWSVIDIDLSQIAPSADSTKIMKQIPGLVRTSKREVLLHEAVLLFYERGYHEVSIEEIGTAAGITASSVYRYFPSKADLLAAAFHRASDRLNVTLGSALAESETPLQAVHTLAERYVAVFFAQSELLAVYFAEIGNLPDDARAELRKIQRLNIEEWAHLCVEARPELTVVQARFLVHAALGLVFDVGRIVGFSEAERVSALLCATLLG